MCNHDMEFLYEGREVKLSFKGEFESLASFKRISDLMPPLGCVKQVILDFSGVHRMEPVELFLLLAEFAALQRYRDTSFSIVKLPHDLATCESSNRRWE